MTSAPDSDISAAIPSSDVPDWSREHKPLLCWSPARSLLASIRMYQRFEKSRWPWALLMRRVAVWRHRWWSIVTSSEIPVTCRIGGGLLLPHPYGIVIHNQAVLGPNCLVFQQVTIGTNGGAAPRIGGHVDIGAGAKILGDIDIGAHARIGANAVVLCDVPAGATAVGVPARILHPEPAPHGDT